MEFKFRIWIQSYESLLSVDKLTKSTIFKFLLEPNQRTLPK
jgi:hypothetical protein